MHGRRLALCASILAFATVTMAAPAAAGPGKPALRDAFDARIEGGVAAQENGVGWQPRADGAVRLPANATHAHFILRWSSSTGAHELLFSVCERWCSEDTDGDGVTERPADRRVASKRGESPLTLRVPVPPSNNLTWEATLENGTTLDLRLQGWVSSYAPAPEASGASAGPATAWAPSTPSAEDGSTGGLAALSTHAALGAGLLAALVALWAALGRPVGLASLYSRIDRDELLEQETRRRIHDLVEARPGINYGGIVETLDLGHGTLDHHLRLLTRGGVIEELRVGRYRLYFVPGALSERERRGVAAAKPRGAQRMLAALAERGTASITGLAKEADLAASTVSYHADRLCQDALVEEQRVGRSRCLSLTELGERVLEHLDGRG